MRSNNESKNFICAVIMKVSSSSNLPPFLVEAFEMVY